MGNDASPFCVDDIKKKGKRKENDSLNFCSVAERNGRIWGENSAHSGEIFSLKKKCEAIRIHMVGSCRIIKKKGGRISSKDVSNECMVRI